MTRQDSVVVGVGGRHTGFWFALPWLVGVIGLTLVPMRLYTRGRHIKLQLGVGRGKKLVDKREDIKRRDQEREIQRSMRER